MFNFQNHKNGFTIIELVVVIIIISILAGIITANVVQYINKSKIAKTRTEIQQIILALEIYRQKHGELPPIGDNCTSCSNPCGEGSEGSWSSVVDALAEDGIAIPDKDAWGNEFCYDDNDMICCGGCSFIYSMGQNGYNDSEQTPLTNCLEEFNGNDSEGGDFGSVLHYDGCDDGNGGYEHCCQNEWGEYYPCYYDEW